MICAMSWLQGVLSLAVSAEREVPAVGFVATGSEPAAFVVPVGPARVRLAETGVAFAFPEAAGARPVCLEFEGGGLAGRVLVAGAALPGRIHVLRGADPAAWRTDLSHHASVRCTEAWPGIAVEFRFGADGLVYDLAVEPGADLGRAVVRVSGHRGLEIDASGALWIDTAGGPLRQSPPRTYAVAAGGERRPVECAFRRIDGDRFGFTAGARAHGEGMVVDPGISFSTFLGGSLFDEAAAVAVDAAGAVFVAGTTNSANFPSTGGAFDPVFGGTFSDAFVVKLNPGAATLAYATFLGGTGTDGAAALALAADGSVRVAGRTQSSDFPLTAGAFDTTPNGGTDGFVLHLSAAGSALAFASLLGGAGQDEAKGVALGAANEVYVAGFTASADFPTTPLAFDVTYNGAGPFGSDAFAARFSAVGNALTFGTFLGGTSVDEARSIAVAGADVAVCGRTDSPDFPTTPGSLQPAFGGSLNDGFVARLGATTGNLLFATFAGGIFPDACDQLWGNAAGQVFVTGHTQSFDFPVAGGFDLFWNGGEDAVVFALDAAGQLVFGTFLGGSADDFGYAIRGDAAGAALVTGSTASANFPALSMSFDPTFNGGTDAFFTKVKPLGVSLSESGFLGGSGLDEGRAIAVNAKGEAFLAGRAAAGGFPTTAGVVQGALAGSADAFVTCLPTATCPNPPSTGSYGSGKAGTGGIKPVLSTQNLPAIPSTNFTITVANGLPFASPLLFLGLGPLALPFDGGTLLVAPLTILALPPLNALGRIDLVVPISGTGSSCGLTTYLQVMYFDPGAAGFYKTAQTNGITLVFGST